MKLFLGAAVAAASVLVADGLKLQAVLYQKYTEDDLPLTFIKSPANPLPISYAPGATTAPTPAPTTIQPTTTTATPTTTVSTNTTNSTGPTITTSAPLTTTATTSAPASTSAPTTAAPATNAPATNAPATNAPATNAPATNAPATNAPATNAPATNAPATNAPATNAPAAAASAPVDVLAILRQQAQEGSNDPTNNNYRQLSSTESMTTLYDNSKPTSNGRRLTDASNRDFTLNLMFCNAKSNSLVTYTSQKPKVETSYSTIFGSRDPDAEGKCYDYDIKIETVSSSAGCNAQNTPGGCNNVYYPGCGGVSVNPLTKEIYVARTGGRSIGKLNYVKSGQSCDGRVIDWLVRFRGKKFNGPADVTFTQTGNLYFTDSPFALATTGDEMLSTNLTVLNAKRDLPFNGVFRRTQNDTQVLDANMTRPRSIAFSPDEDVMYVANADATNPYIKAFKLKADGSKECARTFFDFGNNKLNVDGKPTNKSVTCFRQYPTSVKVDSDGFVYVVMCNNIYVLDGAGTLLGRIEGDAEIHT
ncbi:hypothetical protein As57867_010316, partial [Aphanomyces stellatus]